MLALLALLWCAPASASISTELWYFEDKSARLGIQDLLAQPTAIEWRRVEGNHALFGPTNSRIWFRLRLNEEGLHYGPNDPLLLEVPNAYLGKVEYFRVLDGKIQANAATGMAVPLSERGRPVLRATPYTFRLSAPRDPRTEYFFSVESYFPLHFPVNVLEAPDYAYRHWTRTLFLGLFFGALILAAGFNAFLAISLRSRLYAYYALFVGTIAMAYMAHEGLSVLLLWPEWPWWAQRDLYFFGGLAGVFYTLFLRNFLESPRVSPRLDKALILSTGLMIAGTMCLLISLSVELSAAVQSMIVVMNLLTLAIAINALRQGERPARYFFLASLSFNLAVTFFQLQEAGVIWVGEFLNKAPHVGTALEMFLLSFALADRIRLVNRELARQREAMAHAEKMSALGRMAGEIAHEINNPLAIVHGNAVLIRKLEPGAQVEELATTIEQTAQRMSKVVKGIRAIARDSTRDPFAAVQLETVLQDAVALCRERARGLGVRLELPEISELELRCRSTEICQVLVNLLNNAFDAVDTQEQRVVRMEAKVRDKFVELAVSDSGPGVPPELRGRLLDPFFTTKEVGKGLGLGLSISRTIVEAHGGRLWLDETAAATRFAFTVPLAGTS